ncbi:MAG TPA: sugar phosphorylase [Spirochaetes bacterium]|nr:sugar phosphorylase [Spirochaetota bacterium]
MRQGTPFPSSLSHTPRPDYSRPVFRIPDYYRDTIIEKLAFLYGDEAAGRVFPELERLLRVYYAHKTPALIEWERSFIPAERFTERDAVLITYGDMVRDGAALPLQTLGEICGKYFKGTFSTIHLLPFFPYSSDRGFSVIDFERVDPMVGTWDHIAYLRNNFKLMFDGVFNHISSESLWFREYLNQNPDYLDYFTVFSTRESVSDDHLRILFRPRTTDVLTPYDTLDGRRLVWTTFGPDQVDLNFQNPRVLLKIIEIMLLYVRHGADLLRLDAVTYLWDELGTTGAHLAQTHCIIKLMRLILDIVAPHTAIITETNVAHRDNISYFGDGRDEAQMVYNFALPPLVLYTFQKGDASRLSRWAAELKFISETATYFNFLDSHDGIGVMAAKGVLEDEEIDAMAIAVMEHGGHISYRTDPEGTVSPYELNITWFSAINREDAGESMDLQVRRYLASRSIALVLMGVPGIYLHGLLGSRNDTRAVYEEASRRSINRATFDKKELVRALDNPSGATGLIAREMLHMLRLRSGERAFHPNSSQLVLKLTDAVFAVRRTTVDGAGEILALTNVTDRPVRIVLRRGMTTLESDTWTDLFAGRVHRFEGDTLTLRIEPYGIRWIKATLP